MMAHSYIYIHSNREIIQIPHVRCGFLPEPAALHVLSSGVLLIHDALFYSTEGLIKLM